MVDMAKFPTILDITNEISKTAKNITASSMLFDQLDREELRDESFHRILTIKPFIIYRGNTAVRDTELSTTPSFSFAPMIRAPDKLQEKFEGSAAGLTVESTEITAPHLNIGFSPSRRAFGSTCAVSRMQDLREPSTNRSSFFNTYSAVLEIGVVPKDK